MIEAKVCLEEKDIVIHRSSNGQDGVFVFKN